MHATPEPAQRVRSVGRWRVRCSMPTAPAGPSPAARPGAETDRAQYYAFSRTWAAIARNSGVPRPELDRRLVRYFRRLCRRAEPTTVLEIGAHEASFSRWAAETLPDARVLAFEANPYVHEKYAGELARTRVDYRHLAVGPTTGEVELNLPTDVMGRERELANRMASLGVHRETKDQIVVTVPSVRLDEHVTLEGDDRAVAWIDVEGAIGLVLEGCTGVLDRVDAIYVEVEREVTWEGQWLDVDVAVFLRQHGLLPVARDLARKFQHNLVFARHHLAEDIASTKQAAAMLRP